MNKKISSLLIGLIAAVLFVSPTSAQLFGGSESTPESVEVTDCAEVGAPFVCESAFFMDESEPALIGVMKMTFGPDLAGYESMVFTEVTDMMLQEPGYDNVTGKVDWDFLDTYDDFAAFNIRTDNTTPIMTMIMVLDGSNIYVFITMDVDSDIAKTFVEDTLITGDLVAPPAPFEQVDPKEAPDVSII